MRLKSIELMGFKSFGRKADFEFKSKISAIVGPNGSGKSNVAEAFRFVLGEQSIKSMRGKKGEDLIFNGSQSLPRGNRAAVKIIFDNKDSFLPIDFEEVIIERHVHRDGTNQYFINRSLVRLKDVTELLASANVGSSGHHIISQGEADRILSVNNKERKSMLEEALGLKIYQYKRLASEKKIEKVKENMEAVRLLRKENTPHLNFLKRQKSKIEKVKEMREKLTHLYREYFKREKVYLDFYLNKNEEERKPLIENLANLEEREKEARKVLEEKKKDTGINIKLDSLKNEINKLRREKDSLNFRLGSIEGSLEALESHVPRKVIENDNKFFVFDEVKNLEKEVSSKLDLAISLEDLSQIKSVLKRLKDFLVDFVDKNSKKDFVDNSSVEEKEKIEKLKEEKREKEQLICDLENKEQDFLKEYDLLKENFDKESNSNKDAELVILEISAKKFECNSHLASLENKSYQLKEEEEDYKKELERAYFLVGRQSVQYKDLILKNEEGIILSEEDLLREERREQKNRFKEIEKIKILMEEFGVGVDGDIEKEYEEALKRDDFLNSEIEDLEKSAESLKALIEDLKEKLEEEFKEGLKNINLSFKDFFVLMFGGGKAELILTKEKNRKTKESDTSLDIDKISEEMEEEATEDNAWGIEVDVLLPNKKTRGLQMLSGGERSLTSIALLFAMSQVTPPPFIILDETDAALDEANSRKYGDMVEKLSERSQLILITHNRETMSRAGILYGVTMTSSGISKTLSIKFEEAIKTAK